MNTYDFSKDPNFKQAMKALLEEMDKKFAEELAKDKPLKVDTIERIGKGDSNDSFRITMK